MFKKSKSPCNEALCIMDYVDKKLNGQDVQYPKVDYHIHVTMLNYFEKLLANEKQMSDVAKRMLGITASLSSFDINMSHIAYRLLDFTREMSTVSESNLAIVQQTTASMNQVNETIGSTSDTLEQLSSSSEVLVERNNASLSQVREINTLKDDVMNDARIMRDQIEQLVETAERVNEIVNAVKSIADQTNLLALNASIEAARAGENGRGFAVVAQEIRKLADDTKKSLEGMNTFMSNIHQAAGEGKKSMERTMNSTEEMSQKLDVVTDTIEENVNMLKTTIEDIKLINKSTESIKIAAGEINEAMESSTMDAEKLSAMTQIISADANQSADYAKQISQIDDEMSDMVKDMMNALQGSKNAITNQELIQNLKNAKDAHVAWVKNLKRIVDEMRVYPIQINGTKCAFGHFYHSLNVTHPSIEADWKAIDEIHDKLHELGGNAIEAVNAKNSSQAQQDYLEAQELSKNVIMYLDKIIAEAETQTQKGVSLLGK
ncbi:methyl-accepting chemotaxis protein [Oxobacter pfennigii]|nr:methyl-accepting chemotaxis protein [Oxobacter pfennigii]